MEPHELAVIINERDPLSVEIGNYYAKQRALPAANVIKLSLPADKVVLASNTFNRVFSEIKAQLPPGIQAFALTWNAPTRVNCMSITSAFALGYGKRHCAEGCKAIAPSPYYDSYSRKPYDDHRVRPTMSIAARTIENARFLIDRGVQADALQPKARAYLVITPNKTRNTRSSSFYLAKRHLADRIPIDIVHTRGIRDKFDIMFYFTGIARVPHLNSIGFLPGAMADHLTSGGGKLLKGRQMSALRWLEAGATGSYGTVVEPCNYPQKFPNPAIAMKHYLRGDSLVEAYWKSVLWPGQGIFIGEPLARPYGQKSVPQ